MPDELIDKSKASLIDKTDWRRVLQESMTRCLATKKTLPFIPAVEALVSASRLEFPGWNAKKLIDDEIKYLDKKYELIRKLWDVNHGTDHWYDKSFFHSSCVMMRSEELCAFIFNELAKKRILLYGVRQKMQTSEELPDEEE